MPSTDVHYVVFCEIRLRMAKRRRLWIVEARGQGRHQTPACGGRQGPAVTRRIRQFEFRRLIRKTYIALSLRPPHESTRGTTVRGGEFGGSAHTVCRHAPPSKASFKTIFLKH